MSSTSNTYLMRIHSDKFVILWEELVEEKFPQENFRVVSEMRILAKIRLEILGFVGYVNFFNEIWCEIGF